ncbi:MAG: hypothetical protein IJ133_00185, partial [Clostridia bacterium]|nr:hypothetical protein [Clostridia bacterium]
LFHTGDLVLILPTDDPALFKTNEIIAYSNGTDILVSRITKAEKNEAKENIAYRIKGDGEDIPKEERVKLDLTSVVGRYCLTIRNGTVWLNFFTNGLALLFSALLLFLIVLAFVLSSLLPRRHAARHQVAAPKPVKVPVKKESTANASRSELKAAAKPSAPKPEKNGNATETPVEPPLEKPARKPIRLVEGRVLRPEDRD